MVTKYAKLRELAVRSKGMRVEGHTVHPAINRFNMAVNEDTVLALLDENERLERALTYVVDDYRKVDLHHSAAYWPEDVVQTCMELVPGQSWPDAAYERFKDK